MTYSMADIKARNKGAGHHWFSADTLAFFNSEIPQQMPIRSDVNDDDVYFISSERCDWNDSHNINHQRWQRDNHPEPYKREYTVRVFHPSDGSVNTVGTVGGTGEGYPTFEDALKAARQLAKGG